MKVALVHDWITNIGGAEKVLETIYEIFPESDIYTLFYEKDKIKNIDIKKIKTSFLQKLPFINKIYRYYLPIYPLIIENFNLENYDVIISSSHAVAKGIICYPEQTHICYCHTPMRYIWDMYYQYIENLGIIKRILFSIISHYLRIWDVSSSHRVDFFIANSKFVARRIEKYYNRKATVIYPPVDVLKFNVEENKENYFLTVSRFVPYKRVDIIVSTFKKLKNQKLVIIGDGPEYNKIKKLACNCKNIEILGYKDFNTMRKYLEKAKAFIYTAKEDFGISIVEAQACGTPVIAYGYGGASETVIHKKTGILFYQQNEKALIEAIKLFENIKDKFNPFEIRKHAEKFSKENFIKKFKDTVNKFLEIKLQ